jgi:hypothetical protein
MAQERVKQQKKAAAKAVKSGTLPPPQPASQTMPQPASAQPAPAQPQTPPQD